MVAVQLMAGRPEIEFGERVVDGMKIPIVRVPVAIENRPDEFKLVPLYAEDHHRLEAMGVTESWFLNAGSNGRLYVRFHSKTRGNNAMVARVLLGLWKEDGEFTVRYRDNDPCNLLRHNLKLIVKPEDEAA